MKTTTRSPDTNGGPRHTTETYPRTITSSRSNRWWALRGSTLSETNQSQPPYQNVIDTKRINFTLLLLNYQYYSI